MKGWFFIVVIIALSVSFVSFFPSSSIIFILIALALAIPLSFFKTYRQNFLIHNLTELFIYPGIAAIFVAILSSPPIVQIRGIYAMISSINYNLIYDMWAVWHSGVMQKMAKYQINNLKIFGGFFIPYISKHIKLKLKKKEQKKRK